MHRKIVVAVIAGLAGLGAAPHACGPLVAPAPVRDESGTTRRVPTPEHPGMIFPWFGRSEVRPLISRRLKLVLDYRPIAYC